MGFDMFANGFNSPWQGKAIYEPFPLPKSWRVWTNTMGLGREYLFTKWFAIYFLGGCGQIRWALRGETGL